MPSYQSNNNDVSEIPSDVEVWNTNSTSIARLWRSDGKSPPPFTLLINLNLIRNGIIRMMSNVLHFFSIYERDYSRSNVKQSTIGIVHLIPITFTNLKPAKRIINELCFTKNLIKMELTVPKI